MMTPEDANAKVEAGAIGMYGSGWDSPDPKNRPSEEMKDVWRDYARNCLEAAGVIQKGLVKTLQEKKLERRKAGQWGF